MLLSNHNKIAISLPDQNISYAEMLSAASNYSNLIPENTKKVLIISENRLEWVAIFYGAWAQKCTVVPVDYLSTKDELLYILNDCLPEVIFYSEQSSESVKDCIEELNYSPTLFSIDELSPSENTENIQSIPVPEPEQTALLIYTSGTTGQPKGVMLSFANILTNVDAVSVNKGVPIFNKDERVLMLLPLHHIFPLLGSMVAPLYVGATIALCPKLDSNSILKTLQENKVTIIIGVPRLYKLIVTGIMNKINSNKIASKLYRISDKMQNPALSKLLFGQVHKKFGGHLKFLVSGGAALDPIVGSQFTTLGFEVLEGYGMTEAAPMITFTRPGHVKIGSAGTLLPGTEIKLQDEEILARGKNIMQGYWNKPEETADVLREGWLYTGDLGRVDEKGRLYITGRKKEILVNSSGKNINPVLLEQKLEALSNAILEVGIFIDNDTLKAIIRPDLMKLREQGITDADSYFKETILEPFNQSVSPYLRIKHLTLIDEELPKTRLSKLKRFLLPELAIQYKRKKETTEHPTFQEYTIIKDYIESLTSKKIHPDDHLELDISLDSLDKIGLLVFLNNSFGIEIDEKELMTHQTVAKLSLFVKANKAKMQVEAFNWQQIIREKAEIHLPKTWGTTVWLKNISRVTLALYFKLKSEGRENLPDTPCIIAPNHQSYFDGLFVASFLKNKCMRRTYFYAKEKHLRNKWIRSFADRHNVIVMDIQSDVKSSIQKAAALLKSGKNIMIFPEGTRSLDGALGDFKKTFAILSKELNVPVVPVTINGAYDALPSGSFFPKPFAKISVKFQKPIFPNNHSYDTIKEQVYEKIKSCLPHKKNA